MDKFMNTHKLPRKKTIISNEFKAVIKSLTQRKAQDKRPYT